MTAAPAVRPSAASVTTPWEFGPERTSNRSCAFSAWVLLPLEHRRRLRSLLTYQGLPGDLKHAAKPQHPAMVHSQRQAHLADRPRCAVCKEHQQ